MSDLPAMDELPAMDVGGRLPRLRALLPEAGCDALVVTDLVDVRYLTGFTGSNATVLVTADDLLFVTDGRYQDQAAEQLGRSGVEARIEIAADADPAVAGAARGISRVGLQAESISWAAQRRFTYETLPWAHLVPTSGLVIGLRAVKDEGEVARLRRASRIADEALAAVRHLLHERVTEKAFARALEDEMLDRGAQAPSFETIVGSGPNGAMPHARPTDRVVGSSIGQDGATGELVVIDFGALYDGYHSDMTRTYAVGELSSTQRRMVEVVRASQAAGVAEVRPGTGCRAVDATCRRVIDDAGWGDAFTHGTGHGIGLVIHEDPRVSKVATATLAPGHCVTVEPGVYLPAHGGVRVEDSLAVTTDGHLVLTGAPYE